MSDEDWALEGARQHAIWEEDTLPCGFLDVYEVSWQPRRGFGGHGQPAGQAVAASFVGHIPTYIAIAIREMDGRDGLSDRELRCCFWARR